MATLTEGDGIIKMPSSIGTVDVETVSKTRPEGSAVLPGNLAKLYLGGESIPYVRDEWLGIPI